MLKLQLTRSLVPLLVQPLGLPLPLAERAGVALAVYRGKHLGAITCVCWPPEGEGGRIITGGEDRSVVAWAARDGALMQLLAGIHTHAVASVDMSPDGLHLITGAADATVGVWGPVPMSTFEALARRCGAALGLGISWRDTGGVCDGNNLAATGLAVVDTLGPRGGAIHSIDEFLCADSLEERARLSALILMRVAQHGWQR
jgi:glutamate carboxypeptidase